MTDKIEGLRRALTADEQNHAVRALLAEALEAAGRIPEALEHYDYLLAEGELPVDRLVAVGEQALSIGLVALAARCLEAAKSAGVVEGAAALQARIEADLAGEEGVRRMVGPAAEAPERGAASELFLTGRDEGVTFADVGGLDAVKTAIHRTIILPFQRPDLYLKYGRRAGGGVLLYGPPGCGKTLLARATAGECGLPFVNVRIEDVLDPYLGVSEARLHEAFSVARESAPCVLFIDELDALGYSRRKQQGGAGRALVDQLLQELDAIGSDNRDLLILAATNAPWDVDDGMKRPGRFDRMLFVPPPDEPARARILAMLLEGRPTDAVDVPRLAKSARLFSGADLRAAVEQAIDAVIEEALGSGGEPPLRTAHVDAVLENMRSTTLEWLATARNFVEFANDAGRYDDVAAFLKSREVRAARS